MISKEMIKNGMKRYGCESCWFDGWDYDFVTPDDILFALEKKLMVLRELELKKEVRLTPAEIGLCKFVENSILFAL